MKMRLIRTGVIALGLVARFWTQSLIGQRPVTAGEIGDVVHQWTASGNAALHEHPLAANALLMVSSAIIDAFGIFLLATAIFGASVRPFLGLLLLFGMRQLCQALCSLPVPPGMIWHNPGIPSLLVTYGVANDFFFSGHTAIAVYGSLELTRAFPKQPVRILAGLVALFEAATVLVLRAHYTMDVVGGVLAAFCAAMVAARFAPRCDRLLENLGR